MSLRAHCARAGRPRDATQAHAQRTTRGEDEGFSCGVHRRAPRRHQVASRAEQALGYVLAAARRDGRVLLSVRTMAASAFTGLWSALATARVNDAQPTTVALTLQGKANTGRQRSGLSHAGVLVLFLRRSTQVQHIVAPNQERT